MQITDINGCVTLHNGVRMPYLGLGVFKAADGKEVIDAVTYALQAGYRHIDTATLYQNEKGVGTAVRNGPVKREEVFVTTKVWNSDQGYDATLRAFDRSLALLGFDYLDLYLLHWPVKGLFMDTWKALETLYREGRVRAIGVSNFLAHHLLKLLKMAEIIPMVNQMEFHPYMVQRGLMDFCRVRGIQYEAWGPLIQGRITTDKTLEQLAKKYEKDIAQIVLRWDLQMGVVTIPKSVTPSRIMSNTRIFDFELSDEDMNRISTLNRGERFGANPDNFDF
jgi:diketogulonate reductase-like aldo/keto reductase